jgi:hypothetical protein
MGDPFVAVNYHTSYYRHAEGRPIQQPMTAAEYLKTRLAERPVGTLDVGLNGLFLQPFITKWRGLDVWLPRLGGCLYWLALAGLAVLPFSAGGRLFLVIMLSSLLPYIFTWNLGGGGEWRFTMHAYPFYLVAAAFIVVGALQVVRGIVRNPALLSRATVLPAIRRAAALTALVVLGILVYYELPWFVTREAIAKGESTSLETGPRDRTFYRDGWSPPHVEGITVRVSRADRSIVRVPLAEKRDYAIVLRIDPVAPGAQERVNVLFNRHFVAALRLSWNPERVGSYRVPVRADMVRVGSNELTLVPETLVAASSAGPNFAWLDPAETIGVRIWYVRVLPSTE